MNYDIDYEIYQYINQQAENYISLEELLLQQNLTYDTALQKMAEFKENYHFLLGKYHIRNQNLVNICYDLAKKINQFSENQELQYLYFCVLTDTGLLNPINADGQTEEQTIRNYIRQKEKIQELTHFMEIQKEIIREYERDFTKYEDRDKKLKLRRIYELIPAEIADKNKRYIFTDLDKNHRPEYRR